MMPQGESSSSQAVEHHGAETSRGHSSPALKGRGLLAQTGKREHGTDERELDVFVITCRDLGRYRHRALAQSGSPGGGRRQIRPRLPHRAPVQSQPRQPGYRPLSSQPWRDGPHPWRLRLGPERGRAPRRRAATPPTASTWLSSTISSPTLRAAQPGGRSRAGREAARLGSAPLALDARYAGSPPVGTNHLPALSPGLAACAHPTLSTVSRWSRRVIPSHESC
jgi:hypothetical protein